MITLSNSFKVNVMVLMLFCFYLFPFRIQQHLLLSYSILYLIPCLYILYNISSIYNIFKSLRQIAYCLFLFLFFLIFMTIVPIIHQTFDFSYLPKSTYIIRKFCHYLFLLLLLKKIYQKNILFDSFLLYYALSCAVYVIITILLHFTPSAFDWWLSVVAHPKAISLLDSYGYSMRIGWQGYSGFRCTLRCTLGLIFILFLLYKKQDVLKIKKYKLYSVLVLLFMGNSFYGRSGVVVSAIAIIVIFIYILFFQIKKVPFLVFSILFCFLVILILGTYYTPLHSWYIWLSNPFANFVETGSLNNHSFSILINRMIFLPSLETLLFGDGYYTDLKTGAYYLHTDSGFMRLILYCGIPGLFMAYLLIILLLRNLPTRLRILKIMLLLSFCVFEIKGEVYYEYIPLLFIIILSLNAISNKNFLTLRSKLTLPSGSVLKKAGT